MAEVGAFPLGVVVLVGVIALAIGILIGTLVRGSARTVTVLAARHAWAAANLRTIFGIGRDAADAGRPFDGIVPPDGATPRGYGVRALDGTADGSAELMLLQPLRTGWARNWLFNSQVFLQAQADILHGWLHTLGREAALVDPAWVEADQEYVRRVHRVENTLTHWAAGRWLTHSSLRLRITSRKPFWNRRLQRSLLIPSAPEAVLRGEYPPCDCETGQAPAG